MTTALTTIRQKVAQNLKDLKTGTLTTSSATAPADTNLAEFPSTKFADWYLVPTAGTYAGVVRKVQTFTQTGGIITPYTAFAGATGLVAYELHKYDPEEIRIQINQAVTELYPNLWVPHIDEWSIITGNILPNSAFQDWASASVPDKWTITGSTAAKNTTAAHLRHGTANANISSQNGGTLLCNGLTNPYLRDLAGLNITVKAWVKTATASAIRAGTFSQSSGWVYSSFHSGDSLWHLLTKDVTLDQDITGNNVQIGLYGSDTATVYASSIRVVGPNVQRYLLPTSFKDVRQVFLQLTGDTAFSADSDLAMCDAVGANVQWQELPRHSDWDIEEDGTDKWLILKTDLPTERRLKLVGNKYASALTTETGTIEFDAPQTDLIAAKATALILRAKVHDTASKNYQRDEGLLDYWEKEVERLKWRHSIPRPSRMVW